MYKQARITLYLKKKYVCISQEDLNVGGLKPIEAEIDGLVINLGLKHGLRMPNEAFFHQNPKLLGLSMFSIIQLFLQKVSLYIQIPNFIWD